jgi:hypothetical protein
MVSFLGKVLIENIPLKYVLAELLELIMSINCCPFIVLLNQAAKQVEASGVAHFSANTVQISSSKV